MIQGLGDLSNDLVQKIWGEINPEYNRKGRYYHNIYHIMDMILKLRVVRPKLDNPNVVFLATCYHDIVYDPSRTDNEEKSAEFAVNALTGVWGDLDLIYRVSDYILATKNHMSAVDNDCQYFIDADLSILGSHKVIYDEYVKNIRLEYSMYSGEDYYKGRIYVLNKILKMPFIFKTEVFAEMYESNARKNIVNELKDLENGTGVYTCL